MGTAKWQRVNPAGLLMLGQKGGIMLMATAAKKHVTIFPRRRTAVGAGDSGVKAAFTAAAHKTVGVLDRAERNKIIADGVRGKGPGVIIKKSKSKAHPGKIIARIPTR